MSDHSELVTGKKVPDRDRLLIVTLENVGIRQEVVRLAPQLRSCEAYANVYINPDLTPREREQGRKLREELASRRQKGEKNLVIRKGKIVCTAPAVDTRTDRQPTPDRDHDRLPREAADVEQHNVTASQDRSEDL